MWAICVVKVQRRGASLWVDNWSVRKGGPIVLLGKPTLIQGLTSVCIVSHSSFHQLWCEAVVVSIDSTSEKGLDDGNYLTNPPESTDTIHERDNWGSWTNAWSVGPLSISEIYTIWTSKIVAAFTFQAFDIIENLSTEVRQPSTMRPHWSWTSFTHKGWTHMAVGILSISSLVFELIDPQFKIYFNSAHLPLHPILPSGEDGVSPHSTQTCTHLWRRWRRWPQNIIHTSTWSDSQNHPITLPMLPLVLEWNDWIYTRKLGSRNRLDSSMWVC